MKRDYILPALFIAALTAVGLLYLAVPDRDASESENRRLASLPRLTAASLVDGSFSEDMDEYMKDQFPFRDKFIAVGSSPAALQKA